MMFMRREMLLCLLLFTLYFDTYFSGNEKIISPEFEFVTCQSSIKLQNKFVGHFLHSHPVMYGSGSGQQSVTGYKNADDINGHFKVIGLNDTEICLRGMKIPCGSTIQLLHSETQKYLHSHHYDAPLSNHHQEVSCFEKQNDSGNSWILECEDPSDEYWKREHPIRLKHDNTGVYLYLSDTHKYSQPIQDQLEVSGASRASKLTTWQAREGIYYPLRDDL